jgi:hypothetical protein
MKLGRTEYQNIYLPCQNWYKRKCTHNTTCYLVVCAEMNYEMNLMDIVTTQFHNLVISLIATSLNLQFSANDLKKLQ